ncbi:MAG: hypothetical protein QM791_02140 [Ferruginibacter sp.]
MKIVIALISLILTNKTSYCQIKTTVEEYTYITVAFADDKKTGRDIKAGYTTEDIGDLETISWSDGRWKKVALSFFKKGDEKKAIIIVALDEQNNLKCLCLPTKDSDPVVWDLAYKHFTSLPAEWSAIVNWGLVKAASKKLL